MIKKIQHTDAPRIRKIPKRLEHSSESSPAAQFQPKENLRRNFFEIVDLMINALKDRFNQEGFETLIRLEGTILNAFKCNVPNNKDLHMALKPFSDDFDVEMLMLQLKLLENLPGDKPESCADLARILAKESDTVKHMFQQVILLLVLVMTIPASAATAERSFSALRRLKNYLRSNMTQKRLFHIMLLHVHQEITKDLDPAKLMQEFVSRNEERKRVFGQG